MRVYAATIVALVSVGMTPMASEASPITTESLPAALTAAADNGYGSLLEVSGDPFLIVAGVNTFEPPASHGKLRGAPWQGGIVFTPIGGPSGGPWTGFGGGNPWGGPGGGPSSGPAPGSFTLLSFSTLPPGPDQPQDPDPNQGFQPPLTFVFESGPTLSCESSCEQNTTAVPEPSAIFLLASGVALGVRRAVSRRSAREPWSRQGRR